jgi:hypothetical protein
MGAWGHGIFQDDFACDVRDLYTELSSLGFDDGVILTELQQEFGKLEGINVSTFWIALALSQYKVGRLLDAVKQRALEFIDSGSALQEWTDLMDGSCLRRL